MKQISVVSSRKTWPQWNTEAALEFCDGVEVGPRLSLQHRLNRAVVNTRELLRVSKAATGKCLANVHRELASDLAAVIYRRHIGPSVGSVPRETSRRSGHESSVNDLGAVPA
jgi:hypothetical protein